MPTSLRRLRDQKPRSCGRRQGGRFTAETFCISDDFEHRLTLRSTTGGWTPAVARYPEAQLAAKLGTLNRCTSMWHLYLAAPARP
jgi:hypothetical protein